MRNIIVLILLVLAVAGGILAYGNYKNDGSKLNSMDNSLNLSSTAFQDGQSIPATYTCEGVNVNPPLSIDRMPDGSKSLVLIMYDPNAPGGDFLHWLAWNIPPDTSLIAEESLPADAVQGQNDFGDIGYGGPCPPSGTHHYKFDIYALDTMLELDPTSKRNNLEQAMRGHILGQATLIGTFSTEK